MKIAKDLIVKNICIVWMMFICTAVLANGSSSMYLTDIQVSSLDANRVKVHLKFSHPVTMPKNFSMEKPAKIILDFAGIKNKLAPDLSRVEHYTGIVNLISVAEAGNRTRVVIELSESAPYEIDLHDNEVNVVIAPKMSMTQSNDPFKAYSTSHKLTANASAIKNIDFRANAEAGQVIVDLNQPNVTIDLKEEGSLIKVRYLNSQIAEPLQQILDVSDFGTAVLSINTLQQGNDVEMIIKVNGYPETMAYQADNRFIIEARPISRKKSQNKKEQQDKNNEINRYSGEKFSLNFQNIEVRRVLQVLADFSGVNIVTSDRVTGNVTLRLKNVPWMQALDIIVSAKGLAKETMGNTILVDTSEEIAARKKLELELNHKVEELEPLRSEYIQVNYADAKDLALLLKNGGAEEQTFISRRGAVSVDERTNTLLIQDTIPKLDEIRGLVRRLDVPVRQVLIETRVVFATDDFEDVLGVKFGAAAKLRPGNEPVLGIAGTTATSGSIATNANPTQRVANTTSTQRLMVDLPATLQAGGEVGHLGLTIASLPGGTILDLELSALESEGLGKIVASPRIVTSNQKKAYIEAGEEIPYRESTSSGAASIAFKKAVLKLEVTPQITPDDKIVLDLTVNQDTRGIMLTDGVPSINTREMHTKVLVSNGETVVLGGIYQQEKNTAIKRVPFFGRLPLVGWLFKNESHIDKRNELLIFVTPKIIQDGMV